MQAEALYRKAIAARPEFAGAHSNLGNLLKEQMRFDEALEEFHVTAAWPRLPFVKAAQSLVWSYNVVLPPPCRLLSRQIQLLQRLIPTLATPTRSYSGTPKPLTATTRLVLQQQELGVFNPAIALTHTTHHTPQAIKLDPEFADAYGNLAAAYKDIGKLNTAIEVYLKALKLKPQQANGLPDPIIFCNLMHCLQIVCEWKGRDEVFATTKSIVDSQLADGRLPAVQPHHALVYPLPTDTQLAIAKRVRSPHTSLPACRSQTNASY